MADNIQYLNLTNGEVIPVALDVGVRYIDSHIDLNSILSWMKSNHVRADYRIYVLYPDETINYEIPKEDIKIGGTYSENYQDGQRRSLTFNLYNEEEKYTPNINTLWAGTRIRLDMGIVLPSNKQIWFQRGIFVIQQVNPTLSPDDTSVEVTCADKFALFENKTGTLSVSYEVPVGAEIELVIKDLLLLDIGDGHPFDPKTIVYHSSFKGARTQVTINKNAGDTVGSILLDLATQLNAEIFYNSMGNLTLIPTNETGSDSDKPLLYDYDEELGDISGLNFSFDLSNIVNRVIVIGSSANGGVVSAVAVNGNPGSPLCYQRIGYRTDNVINDSNITTTMLAEERAQYELRKRMILKSSTSLNVIYNPLLTVNNLIALNSSFYKLSHEKFLIQSLTYPLDYSGSISVTVSNIRNLPTLTKITQ